MLNIYDLYCVSTVQSPRIFAIRKFSIVLVTAVSRQNAHCEITEELWATKIVTCNLCLNSLPTKKCPTCRIGTMSEEEEDEYSAAMKNPYR